MKKLAIISISSFIFLIISSAVAYLLRYIPYDNPWVYLTVGLTTLAVSAIVAFAARKIPWLNGLCIFISSLAIGAFIRSWYILRGFDNPFWMIALVSLASVAYLWVYYLLSLIPLFKKRLALFTSIWLLLSLGGYLALVFLTETTWVSTFGYYMLIEIAFILSLYSETESVGELVRTLALSTFAVFGVVVFVGAMVLLGGGDCDCDGDGVCECCECLEGCGDCGCDNDRHSKRKGKKSKMPEIKP